MKPITHLIVHHSASPRDSTTLEDLARWHTDPAKPGGPFDAVAYHFVIEGYGRLRYGRHVRWVGAHSAPNAAKLGVCIVGDQTDPDERWSSTQLATLRLLVVSLRMIVPDLDVIGHRDDQRSGYTECPGLEVGALNL
jgi:hypothetical protein